MQTNLNEMREFKESISNQVSQIQPQQIPQMQPQLWHQNLQQYQHLAQLEPNTGQNQMQQNLVSHQPGVPQHPQAQQPQAACLPVMMQRQQ